MLEKQSFLTNTGMSVVIGLAIYFGLIHHLLPSTLPGEYYSLKEDAKEVLSLMGFDNNGIGEELPAFQLMKAKGAIIGKVYEVADIAEIHAQEKLVKEMLMRSKEGK